MNTLSKKQYPTLIVAAFLLAAIPLTHGASGPRLAPADVTTYIQIDNLAALQAKLNTDPVIKQIADSLPFTRKNKAWKKVQRQLSLTGPEIISAYFGKQVIVFSKGTSAPQGLILSRIKKADAQHAIRKLGLTPFETKGPFTYYHPKEDKKSVIAFSDQFLAAGDHAHLSYIQKTLTNLGNVPSLADDPQFKKWTANLPGKRNVLLFTRNVNRGHFHAISADITKPRIRIDITSQIPELSKGFKHIGPAAPLDFGPLPADTFAALTLNLIDAEFDRRESRFLDQLFVGKSFNRDIKPKLGAPVLLFAGSVPAKNIQPNPGHPIPAFGVALKLKDKSVGNDINAAMNRIMIIASFFSKQQLGEPVIPFGSLHNGNAYSVVNFGKAFADKFNFPTLAGSLRLTYGQVGDWYIVTTHDDFYKRCIDAAKDPKKSLAASPFFKSLTLAKPKKPIATLVINSASLTKAVDPVIKKLKGTIPIFFDIPQQFEGANRGPMRLSSSEHLVLSTLHQLFQKYNSVAIQVSRSHGQSFHIQIGINEK